MTDVVITVPQKVWAYWLAEGDCAGDGRETWEADEYVYTVPTWPDIARGERVYVVAFGKLRGWAPLTEVYREGDQGRVFLVRAGGAQAVTIDTPIRGFRGYRYRWWDREEEKPFPEWQTP